MKTARISTGQPYWVASLAWWLAICLCNHFKITQIPLFDFPFAAWLVAHNRHFRSRLQVEVPSLIVGINQLVHNVLSVADERHHLLDVLLWNFWPLAVDSLQNAVRQKTVSDFLNTSESLWSSIVFLVLHIQSELFRLANLSIHGILVVDRNRKLLYKKERHLEWVGKVYFWK